MSDAQETTGTELAPAERRAASAYLAVRDKLESYLPEVARALPAQFSTPEKQEQFVRVVMNLVRFTPELAACTLPSVVNAVATAAAVGLEPGNGLGQCYIIPYRQTRDGRTTKLAQFQFGYKGLIVLAHRGGISDVCAYPVYREDEFSCVLGTEPTIVHRPSFEARHTERNIVAFYAVATLSEIKHVEWMSKADVDEVRKRAQAAKGGPWASDYAEMGRKTVIKRCLKQLPLSTEVSGQLAIDESVRDRIDADLLRLAARPSFTDADLAEGATA